MILTASEIGIITAAIRNATRYLPNPISANENISRRKGINTTAAVSTSEHAIVIHSRRF